jgi:hypothetical protein
VLAALAVAVPAAWFVPEWIGSGELLRSGDRARVPNPAAPATADRPAFATLELALTTVVFLPAAAAALLARGRAVLPALAGAAWLGLVAIMSEIGFSGEARYALPGAAVLAVSGGAGVARGYALLAQRGGAAVAPLRARTDRTARLASGGGVTLALAAAAFSPGDIADLPQRLSYQHRLAADLDDAIAQAGGAERIRALGRPAVGRYRGTLLAYALDVPKHRVRADGAPGDVTFASRLTRRAAPSPPGRGAVLAKAGTWTIYSPGSCCDSDTTGAKRSPCSSTRRSTVGASKTSSSGSPASSHARTSSHVTGVDTVGRSFALSE